MKGTCPRCAGLLIKERSYFCQYESKLSLTMIRCVNCGYYTDHGMDLNRQMAHYVIKEVA